jgi:RNA polymerase sigma factor (sigma-70 family)
MSLNEPTLVEPLVIEVVPDGADVITTNETNTSDDTVISEVTTTSLILPSPQPALIIPEGKVFKWFKAPREPKLITRKDTVRKIRDASGNVIKEIKRKGHTQVCNIEIKRCTKAIETREKAIALAEKKLAIATTPLTIEKAKERLEVAILRRDNTLKRLDMFLDYAGEHNLKRNHPQARSKAAEIKHIIKVRDDIALTAAVKAGGSRSNDAFIKIQNEYKWLVTRFARPGKTTLELDDAFARGVQGLWDAAMRFDATRSGASYSTVAFNWVYRNTRARTRADLKPGQLMINKELKYSISIDGQQNEDCSEQPEFSFASTESSTTGDSLKLDVTEALLLLESAHQEILHMRHFSGMSYEQIAKRVKMPIGLVKQLTGEAHELLQEKLRSYSC